MGGVIKMVAIETSLGQRQNTETSRKAPGILGRIASTLTPLIIRKTEEVVELIHNVPCEGLVGAERGSERALFLSRFSNKFPQAGAVRREVTEFRPFPLFPWMEIPFTDRVIYYDFRGGRVVQQRGSSLLDHNTGRPVL